MEGATGTAGSLSRGDGAAWRRFFVVVAVAQGAKRAVVAVAVVECRRNASSRDHPSECKRAGTLASHRSRCTPWATGATARGAHTMRSELDGGTVDREWPRGDGAPRGRCCVNMEAMVEGATGTAGSLSRGDGAAWRRSRLCRGWCCKSPQNNLHRETEDNGHREIKQPSPRRMARS